MPLLVAAQGSAPSSSKSAQAVRPSPKPALDPGAVKNGAYWNKTLGVSCKIPSGWVLRTEEMNADEKPPNDVRSESGTAEESRVLLAAFSRPPEAHGAEINASILIAAEPASRYPGVTEAAQYLGTLTEVAKARGFVVDEEPYSIAQGTKTLVRGDFHKDVGTRVMRQSTLALLEGAYLVSITVIAGTEGAVEELIDGLDFAVPNPSPNRRK